MKSGWPKWVGALMGLASALFTWCAFVNPGIGAIFAMFMFIPVLVALSMGSSVTIPTTTFSIAFAAVMFWGLHHYSLLAYLAAVSLLAIFMAVPFVITATFSRPGTPGSIAVIVFASAYVVLDWVVSLQSVFPIGRLGATMAGWPWLVQPASLVGPYGLGFLVCLINATLARAVGDVGLGRQAHALRGLVVASALLGSWSCLGAWLDTQGPAESTTLSVAVVQGSISKAQYQRRQEGDGHAAASIRDVYVTLTEPVIREVDLVIWPETAVWGFSSEDRQAITDLVHEVDAHLLGGFPIHVSDIDGNPIQLNAALYFRSGQAAAGFYAKRHLLPFFEREFERGIGPEILRTDRALLAVPICFEAVLTRYLRRLVTGGAEAFVVLSNDAGFGWSTVSHYMLKQAMLHAVAAGKPLIRAGQSGVSAIVDAEGRVRGATRLFDRTVLTGSIRPNVERTVYILYGDWFPLIGFVVMFVGVATRWTPRLAGRVGLQ